MQEAPEIVFRIAGRPDSLREFLIKAIILSDKLRLIDKTGRNSDEIKIKLATIGKHGCSVDATISQDSQFADLHLRSSNPEASERLAEAVAEITRAIVKYHWLAGQNVLKAKLKVSEAEIERVATFLQNHSMSTIEQISDALDMRQSTVVYSLFRLEQIGIVGCNQPDVDPRRYFLR